MSRRRKQLMPVIRFENLFAKNLTESFFHLQLKIMDKNNLDDDKIY